MAEEAKSLEIRCPNGPRRLFMKVISLGDEPAIVPDLNLMELACSDCARQMRKDGHEVFRVLHRYALDGSLVESVIIYKDSTVTIQG